MTSNTPLKRLRPHTTHYACDERLAEYGGKTVGCCCTGHECKQPQPDENGGNTP